MRVRRQVVDRLQLGDPGREVERAARIRGAVKAGRVLRRHRPRRRGPCRRSGAPSAARAADGRTRRASRAAASVASLAAVTPWLIADDAPQHLDEQPGQREVGPVGVRRRVHQHDPAPPALFGGDERRAVGQPRPGLAGELDVGLGQHLARHRHVGRDRQPGKRAVRARTAPASPAAPTTSRRRSCGRRGAAAPAAGCRPSRPGAARQSAAACRPHRPIFRSPPLRPANPGSNRRRSAPRAGASSRSAAWPRRTSVNGCQRAFEVIVLAEQRLALGVRRCGDADRTAAPALVDEQDRTGRLPVFDLDPGGLVAQLVRHRQRAPRPTRRRAGSSPPGAPGTGRRRRWRAPRKGAALASARSAARRSDPSPRGRRRRAGPAA